MDDLISRQAAIDAVDEGAELIRRVLDNMDVVGGERSEFAWGLGLLESCIDELNGLPSAQPEIIRCKDCKWCEDADGLICKNTASWVVATDYDFGCVCAERRQNE